MKIQARISRYLCIMTITALAMSVVGQRIRREIQFRELKREFLRDENSRPPVTHVAPDIDAAIAESRDRVLNTSAYDHIQANQGAGID